MAAANSNKKTTTDETTEDHIGQMVDEALDGQVDNRSRLERLTDQVKKNKKAFVALGVVAAVAAGVFANGKLKTSSDEDKESSEG